MKNSDLERLIRIKQYCDDIAAVLKQYHVTLESFQENKLYFHAISMCLMQIGEFSTKLSEDFRQQTGAQIPWGEIRGMRHLFAHAYQKMSERTIWDTATKDIPHLLQFCIQEINQALPAITECSTPEETLQAYIKYRESETR